MHSSLGDLSDDIIGGRSATFSTVANKSSDVDDDLQLSWLQRNDGQQSVVPNNGRLALIPDPSYRQDQDQRQHADLVKKVKKLCMDQRPLEARQVLAAGDFNSHPDLASLEAEIGLLGNIYLDPSAFDDCRQMKDAFKRTGSRTVVAVKKIARCQTCQNSANGLCLVVAKSLVDKIDYNQDLFDSIQKKLALMDNTLPNISIKSIDDLKSAFVKTPAKTSRAYAGPVRQQNQSIDSEHKKAALDSLTKTALNKQSTVQNEVDFQKNVKPVLTAVYQEMILGKDNAKLRDFIARKSFPEATVKKAFGPLQKMIRDPRIAAGITLIPELFETCIAARDFLHDNGIKTPPFTQEKKQCPDCRNNVNGNCSQLGSTLLKKGEPVPLQSRLAAIDSVRTQKGLSAAIGRDFITAETKAYFAGLSAVLAFSKPAASNPTALGSLQDSLVFSAEKYFSRENAIIWVRKKLSAGAYMSDIRKVLRQAVSEKDQARIEQESLYGMRTILADSLNDCTHHSYALSHGTEFIRAEKCNSCRYATALECSRQRVKFSGGTHAYTHDNETAESKEIKSIFAGNSMVVDIDAKKQSLAPLEIEGMSPVGPDVDMDGHRVTGGEDINELFKSEDRPVDIDRQPHGTPPAGINMTVGEWDVSSFLS